MKRKDIKFRPIKPKDSGFLLQVYSSTRTEELTRVDWDEKQKEEFLQMQFNAQHKYYQQVYTKASFDIIQIKETDIGRLYLHRGKKDVRIIDIAILPEHRNKGVGSLLIKEILAEAVKKKKTVSIHVEHNNPAMTLYKRLGFHKLSDKGIYHLMKWKPGK